jgi:hypothetical protein
MTLEAKFGMVLGLLFVIVLAVTYHSPIAGRPTAVESPPQRGGPGNPSPRISLPSAGGATTVGVSNGAA